VKVKLGNLAPRHPNTFKAAVSTKAWFSAAAANEDAAHTNLQLQVGARCFEHVVTKKTD